MQWLRRSLVAGFVVTVPLVISVAAFVWLFQAVDGVMVPVYAQWLGREVPGLGLVTLLAVVVMVGALTTNVLGRRLFDRGEAYLPPPADLPGRLRSGQTARGGLLARQPARVQARRARRRSQARLVFGFLTKEFSLERERGVEHLMAVYVPTNHIYFGDIHIYPRSVVTFPDITVQEGVQVFLTGGMALSEHLHTAAEQLRADRVLTRFRGVG